MSRTTYLLLPHAQEKGESFEALSRQTRYHTAPWTRLDREPPTPWFTYSRGVDPLAVVEALHRVEWEHAPLLAYRSAADDSWSHLRIVKRVATLWGDAKAGG